MKKIIRSSAMIIIAISIIASSSLNAFAFSSTGYANANLSGRTVANLEARIWAGTGTLFNATSSSWAFNCSDRITGHQNSMKLNVNSVGHTLSVGISSSGLRGSITMTGQTSTMAQFSDSPRNGYYSGINTSNNEIVKPWWAYVTSMATYGFTDIWTLDAYSYQSIAIDTQQFNNQGHTTKYF
jgi:hypothetical protein